MPELKVKTQSGKESGAIKLADEVFGVEPNAVLVREVYNAYRTNQRQGTHSTKTRGAVRGGGRKPWKQKGTGRARAGSVRSPIWRGGAITFGPLPRDYEEKVNKKKRKGAYRSLLSDKIAKDEVIVIDEINLSDSVKTKEVVELREKLGLGKEKVLLVTAAKDEKLFRASRNLGSSSLAPTTTQVVSAISIFDLLTCDKLVITKEAMTALEERLK